MNDHTMDEFLFGALRHAREAEPTAAEIARVVAAAGVRRPRRRLRRPLAIVLVAFTVAGGVAAAVPQTRDAIVDGFDAFTDFVFGGDPPGEPLPSGSGELEWVTGTDEVSGAVVARSGDKLMVAYRDPATGMACISYGAVIGECRPDDEWIESLRRSPVRVTGPFPDPDAQGRYPLYGLVADTVAAVELRYRDGPPDRVTIDGHGFATHIDPNRGLRTLVAYDEAGTVIGRVDLRGR